MLLYWADIEDGHTLHLVERPEGIPAPNTTNDPQQQQERQQRQRVDHRRINIGMIDTNGAVAALGVRNKSAS